MKKPSKRKEKKRGKEDQVQKEEKYHGHNFDNENREIYTKKNNQVFSRRETRLNREKGRKPKTKKWQNIDK